MGRFLKFLAELTSEEKKQGQSGWMSQNPMNRKDNEVELNYYDDSVINLVSEPTKQLPERDLANIFAYVRDDVKPHGEIAKSLDKLVSISSPINRSILSYRGIMLPTDTVLAMQKSINDGHSHVFTSEWPSSWTNSQSVAWDFVKLNGYRNRTRDATQTSVVFEILIPAGTKIGRLALSFGVGNEHVLPSNTKIQLTKVRTYRTGVIFSGRVVP